MMTLVIVSNKVKLGFLMGKIFQRKTTFEALTVFFKGFLKVDGVQRVTECTLVLDGVNTTRERVCQNKKISTNWARKRMRALTKDQSSLV